MDHDAYLASVLADGIAFATAARGRLDHRVPSCPDWTMTDLMTHLGNVHRWAAGHLRGDEDLTFVAPDGDPLDWFVAGHEDLASEIRAAEPAADAGRPWGTAANWTRRMAHETAVHRWDAENTAGDATPFDAALAVDGVDEYLDVLMPRMTRGRTIERRDTIHLHATDAPGEWLVELSPADGIVVRHGHEKGDVAVRGTASDLMLFVWGRPCSTETFGDESVLGRYAALTAERART